MRNRELTAVVLAADEPADAAPKRGAEGFSSMLVPFVMIAFVWYFLLLRPQRREAAKRADLLNDLKKNDRVITYGGMLGTIANISQDGREVTLKVDENTRIRFLKSAIQTVVRDEAAATTTPAAENDKPA